MGKLADNGNLNAKYLPHFSGNWNNSDNAGTFQLHVNNSTSNSNSNIGTHSCFILIKVCDVCPTSWSNTKQAIKIVLVG